MSSLKIYFFVGTTATCLRSIMKCLLLSVFDNAYFILCAHILYYTIGTDCQYENMVRNRMLQFSQSMLASRIFYERIVSSLLQAYSRQRWYGIRYFSALLTHCREYALYYTYTSILSFALLLHYPLSPPQL